MGRGAVSRIAGAWAEWVAVLGGSGAALAIISALVPAPFRWVASLAVAAGEWSVWLSLLGTLACGLAVAALTLLVYGGRDQYILPEHTERLAQRLAAASVDHQMVRLPYAKHGFDYLFSGRGSSLLRPLLLRFLRTYL